MRAAHRPFVEAPGNLIIPSLKQQRQQQHIQLHLQQDRSQQASSKMENTNNGAGMEL